MQLHGGAWQWRLLLMAALWAGPCFCTAAPVKSAVRYEKQEIAGAVVHVAYVDLNDKQICVTPLVAHRAQTRVATFGEFFLRHQPVVQVTGSFYDTRSGQPIGDIVVHGNSVVTASQHIGTALALTVDNRAVMLDKTPPGKHPWSGYESVLQGGVRLVRNSCPTCSLPKQGFRDTYMQRNTFRIAVGLISAKQLLLVGVTSNISLPQLAGIMVKLGCKEAMALDGGASTGFACNGHIIVATRRKLSNVLAVVKRPPEHILSHPVKPGSSPVHVIPHPAARPAKPGSQSSGSQGK